MKEELQILLLENCWESAAAALEAKKEISRGKEERQRLQDRINVLESKIKGAPSTNTSVRSSNQASDEIDELLAQLQEVQSINEHLQHQFEAAQEQLAACNVEIADLTTKLMQGEEELQDYRGTVKALTSELRCRESDVQRLQLENEHIQSQQEVHDEQDINHENEVQVSQQQLEEHIKICQSELEESERESNQELISTAKAEKVELRKQLEAVRSKLEKVDKGNTLSQGISMQMKPETSPGRSVLRPKALQECKNIRPESIDVIELSDSDDSPVSSTIVCPSIIPEVRRRAFEKCPKVNVNVPNFEDMTRHFSRPFLSKLLGGGSIETVVNIHKNTPLSSSRNITAYLCPNIDYNPWCPTVPGTSGYMFVGLGQDKEKFSQPCSRNVFVRVGNRKCRYLGVYTAFTVAPLTAEEWHSLPEATKVTYSETTRVKTKDQRSASEIMEAYDLGDLRVPCVRLKCTGFDEELYENLVAENCKVQTPAATPHLRKRGFREALSPSSPIPDTQRRKFVHPLS